MSRPAADVKGSTEFSKFLIGQQKGSAERHLLDTALETLKTNIMSGVKIPKPQWPPYYIRKYGVNNLWKLNLSREARLVYTILSNEKGLVVVVLEAFLTHKEYERRFGYR